MRLRDLLAIAGGNLVRLKLRTFLTIAGVVIAIAAFVAMLSFGAGNQRLVDEQYEKFGLFFTMQVYPQRAEADSTTPAPLDDSALAAISAIPGVRIAYPFHTFAVEVKVGDSTVTARAQALPVTALRTQLYSQLAAGHLFETDSVHEVLVSRLFLAEKLGVDTDSIIGTDLELTVRLVTLDSALVGVFRDREGQLRRRFRAIRYDSLIDPGYLRRTVRSELGAALERVLDGLLNARARVSDTLRVCGVLETSRMGRHRTEPIILPMLTARELTAGSLSEDPADLFTALAAGRMPTGLGPGDLRSYPRVTLDLDRDVPYARVKDSVEALGFRTFSYAEQFDEIRRFFLYFDMALGLIGLIALITASLGIANTLLMAILERKREIGVLKSLGADERDIRLLFFVESGVIGVVGATAGIAVGWAISRLGSVIARMVMERQGVEPVDFFTVPIWLIGAALIIGTAVSVLAGFYPAARAARVDPVESLRAE